MDQALHNKIVLNGVESKRPRTNPEFVQNASFKRFITDVVFDLTK